MKDQELIELGQRIRELRQAQNLTQTGLAERCKCNRNYISMLERGERNPSYKSLVMIADGLDVKLSKFYNIRFYRI